MTILGVWFFIGCHDNGGCGRVATGALDGAEYFSAAWEERDSEEGGGAGRGGAGETRECGKFINLKKVKFQI